MPAKPNPAKLKPAKPKAPPTKPLVCLVTPADAHDTKHKSRDAFEDELQRLGLTSAQIDYKVYYGSYSPTTLRTKANTAVSDAQSYVDAHQRAVIVTAGTMATAIVQGLAPNTIPIIQAAGGAMPTRQTNVTGFYIDAQGTSQSQFDKLSVYGTVTILYDSTNEPPSNSAYLALAAYAIQRYPLVTENSLDIHDLTRLVSTDIEGSF